jgi:hypothetical protein
VSGRRARVLAKQRAHLHSAASGRFVSPVGADKATTVAVSEHRRLPADERELWREYATALLAELNSRIGLAVAHGWRGNPEGAKRGEELRAALGIEAGTHADLPSPGLDLATVTVDGEGGEMDKTSGEVE